MSMKLGAQANERQAADAGEEDLMMSDTVSRQEATFCCRGTNLKRRGIHG